MPIKLRDLTKYRWAKNFHHILWEKIKAANPDMPRWSFEQLTANGWSIRSSEQRGKIELIHTDGTVKRFIPTINGQEMAHVEGMFCNIYGFNHKQIKRSELPELKATIERALPDYEYILKPGKIIVNVPASNLDDSTVFRGVQDVPLDESYIEPGMTTSKEYVLGIINLKRMPTFDIVGRK